MSVADSYYQITSTGNTTLDESSKGVYKLLAYSTGQLVGTVQARKSGTSDTFYDYPGLSVNASAGWDDADAIVPEGLDFRFNATTASGTCRIFARQLVADFSEGRNEVAVGNGANGRSTANFGGTRFVRQD